KERTLKCHRQLGFLRLCDTFTLSRKQLRKAKKKQNQGFVSYSIRQIGLYIGYLFKTWTCVWKQVLFGSSTHPAQLAPVFVFATVASLILYALLLYCIIERFPSRRFRNWLEGKKGKHANTMFQRITLEQVAAAKRALSRPLEEEDCGSSLASKHKRVFNLDIAKLCCQLSALMYQHNSDLSHEFLETLRTEQPLKHIQDQVETSKDERKGGKGRQRKERKEVKKKRSLVPNFSVDAEGPGDIQLVQAPGIKTEVEVGTEASIEDPESLLTEYLGGSSVDHEEKHQARSFVEDFLKRHSSDSEILKFCAKFGIEYAAISELNSSSAAYASIFWDPASNWIILAFKGTGSTDFSEWITDLDYNLVHSGSWLRGFGRVHGGFADRIFPRDVRALKGRRPYDTIAAAIKIVDKALRLNGLGDTNVYFTGHSLGTAIASLAYSRVITGKHDFGKNIAIRDAYLFATPILCDVYSVHAFNFAMFEDLNTNRTMWRISNRNDVVATLLPEQGDCPTVANPNSLLAFAHLGTEIGLPDVVGKRCTVSGNHITHGTAVVIDSEFDDEKLEHHFSDGHAKKFGCDSHSHPKSDPLLDVPILGALLAHGIENYWASLRRRAWHNALAKVSNGKCKWVDN
ncbi:hypothetical protein FRB99_006131, partial [Tulasnella sp. 403]